MTTPSTQTLLIDLSKLDLLPDSRQHDPEKLETLAQDMKAQGQLQEIVVTPVHSSQSTANSNDSTVSGELSTVGLRYQVIAGAGRTAAARKLGWAQIRALVREGVSEFDKARITFAENEDREDADAFYQAEQIQKMLDAKKCTQKILAAELGVSDSLISDYVMINDLPQAIKQNSRRLEFGVLDQITRLNESKMKIRLAKKCLKNDLSVRQVKAIVDKALAKGEKPAKQLTAAQALKARATAGFQFSQDGPDIVIQARIPRTADLDSELTRLKGALLLWCSQHPYTMTAEEAEQYSKQGTTNLGQDKAPVVQHMENFLKNHYVPSSDDKANGVRDAGRGVREKEHGPFDKDIHLPHSASRTPHAPDVPRLPESPAEHAELEKLASESAGPGPIYAWVYGADNRLAVMMQHTTWQEIGEPDGKEGLPKLLAAFGKVKNLAPVR